MNNLLVTIVIPVHNQIKYIAQTVESAFNQSYENCEVILSDDASTDDTPLVIEQLKQKWPRLKALRQPLNLGITRHVASLLKEGTGEFIVRLDSDDLLHEKYVETLIAEMIKNPRCGYAHCAVKEIDSQGNQNRLRLLARDSGFQDSDQALHSLSKAYSVAANILMFRRAALEHCGLENFPHNFAEDWYLAVELADKGWGNIYVADVLASYRVWGSNSRSKRKLDELKGINAVFNNGLRPAFKSRGWSIKQLEKRLDWLAVSNMNCLEWTLWSESERIEIKDILTAMSCSTLSRICMRLVESGHGDLLQAYFTATIKVKDFAKQALKVLRTTGRKA